MSIVNMLNIGCTPDHNANNYNYWIKGTLVVCNMDVDESAGADLIQDITQPVPDYLHNKFDIVWASHVLEHISRNDLRQAVQNMYDMLKPGGELWVWVPCMEYACREILAGRDTSAVQALVFGGQKNEYDFHRTGYTLDALTVLVSKFNMEIKQAGVGQFAISTAGKEDQLVEQNVVVGVKI